MRIKLKPNTIYKILIHGFTNMDGSVTRDYFWEGDKGWFTDSEGRSDGLLASFLKAIQSARDTDDLHRASYRVDFYADSPNTAYVFNMQRYGTDGLCIEIMEA